MAERVALEDEVALLERTESYPERPSRVEALETHMSHLFLLDRNVYKLKKPVKRAFLDFSTVDARLRNASEEIRLNRRLAPDVYLGVVALTRDAEGRLALGGEGEVVDWLVRMRRLPPERMLDRALRSGEATEDDARRVGDVLAAFYASAERVPFAPEAYVERISRDVRANADEIRRLATGNETERVTALERSLLAFVDRRREDLSARARDGRIVEAHGDLRPEHVALGPPPLVIDCLEFNRDLRTLDPQDELAFFRLECELQGAGWFGDRVVAVASRSLNDPAPPELASFYGGYRALVRSKLAIWHLSEPRARGAAYWREKSHRYLEQAERLARAALEPGERAR